jgi:hypothetical protein
VSGAALKRFCKSASSVQSFISPRHCSSSKMVIAGKVIAIQNPVHKGNSATPDARE